MEYDIILSAISQLGFPVAVCLGCFWFINKMQDNHREDLKNMTDAVNNNTLVMQKLLDNMEASNK